MRQSLKSSEPKHEKSPTLYERLLAAGAKLDSHESDLYVRIDAASAPFAAELADKARHFQHEGEQWVEIPFAYDPFWKVAG